MLYWGMGLVLVAIAASILGFVMGMPGLTGLVSVALLVGLTLSLVGVATLDHHRLFHRRHAHR